MKIKIKKSKEADSNEGVAVLDGMIQKDLSKKMTLEQNDIELSERQVIDVSRERRLQVPKQVYLLW